MAGETFADLEARHTVSVQSFRAILEDYATRGWAIASLVVIALVKRTEPNAQDTATLLASARRGFEIQRRRREIKAALEYHKVVVYLENHLSQTAKI